MDEDDGEHRDTIVLGDKALTIGLAVGVAILALVWVVVVGALVFVKGRGSSFAGTISSCADDARLVGALHRAD